MHEMHMQPHTRTRKTKGHFQQYITSILSEVILNMRILLKAISMISFKEMVKPVSKKPS